MNWTPKEIETMRARALGGFSELRAQFKAGAGNAETSDEKEYAQYGQEVEKAQSLYEANDKKQTLDIMNALKDVLDKRSGELRHETEKKFLGKTFFGQFYAVARKAEEFKNCKRRIKGMLFDIGFSIKPPPAASP